MMSERLPTPDSNNGIAKERLTTLIDKIKTYFAPYEMQPVDTLGAYETKYIHEDSESDVVISVPTLVDMQQIDPNVDDTLRVIVRQPEDENEEGVMSGCVTTYAINLTDLTARYSERTVPYDSETDEYVAAPELQSVKEILAAHEQGEPLSEEGAMTADQLRELEELLDDLDPSQRY